MRARRIANPGSPNKRAPRPPGRLEWGHSLTKVGVAVFKVISGGQTGVDRAALDVALGKGLACGGWCPLGRLAEDGPLPARYPLVETPTADYAQRTEWNVRDSDGTLLLTAGRLEGGSAFTAVVARRLGRPTLRVDLGAPVDAAVLGEWTASVGVRVLNVAGPRESRSPGIYGRASAFLEKALR
jgi:Circularly permutated YpsA SLOG family